jgi:hypothetical protein
MSWREVVQPVCQLEDRRRAQRLRPGLSYTQTLPLISGRFGPSLSSASSRTTPTAGIHLMDTRRMRAMPLVILLVACGTKSGAPREVTATDLERGRTLAGNLKKSLFTELGAAMSRGLPVAIDVCQSRAPAIAADLAKDGARVGRATRRTRNPQNRGDGWTLDAITYFEDLHARRQPLAAATFSRVLDDGRVAYAEPLVIQELCVKCHGKELASDVRTALAARYPDDQATGYAVGDLRGVVWVELPR